MVDPFPQITQAQRDNGFLNWLGVEVKPLPGMSPHEAYMIGYNKAYAEIENGLEKFYPEEKK